MSSKRVHSGSSQTASGSMDVKKRKKEGLVKPELTSKDRVAEKKESFQSLRLQSVMDDPKKIKTMKAEELRILLREAGIPSKGRKCDLVSSLECFIEKQSNENETICETKLTASESYKFVGNGSIDCPLDENGVSSADAVVKVSSVRKEKTSKTAKPDTSCVAEPWTVLAHKKPQKGWIAYNPKTMRSPSLNENTKFLKLMSWNVNGLRALLKLEDSSALDLAQRESFDVLCLQETKLQEKDVESIKQSLLDGYDNSFWTCSRSKLGYSGTAIISRVKPLSVTYGLGIEDHDNEGRIVTAEFDFFYLLSAYVPNSGDGLKRLTYRVTEWDPALSKYMKELEKTKPVILTGDLNCANEEIDIYNPAGNRRSAGFTDEERQSFKTNFLSKGFVDTFRKQHPDAVGYTYWGYRHGGRKTNRGWRLDYFLVSESIAKNVHDSYIFPEVLGSDHCPIGLIIKL